MTDTSAIEELLTSIDDTLKKMLRLAQQRTSKITAAQGPTIADDRDLDSQWGDPAVRKMPPRWKGDDFSGLHMSQCPAELLDALAGFFDWAAGKAEENNERTDKGKAIADYKRMDAARARGWAKRIREGKVQQDPTAGEEPATLGGDNFEWPTAEEVFRK